MSTKLHSALVDSDGIHEPKGASTATIGQVWASDGAGSGSMGALGSNDPAWITTFVPVVTASTGTITTAAATCSYKQIGKTVLIQISITITTNGTGAGQILVTLPFASIRLFTLNGGGSTVSGKACWAFTIGSNLRIYQADSTYPGSSGEVITVSGVYEST